MACPYFYPTETLELAFWGRRSRLPLGDPHRGLCRANSEESAAPEESALQQWCNLGYARHCCSRFPARPGPDAVRFAISGDRENIITIYYAFERDHQPDGHGGLEYDRGLRAFRSPPPDPILRRQAEAYVESYLRRLQLR